MEVIGKGLLEGNPNKLKVIFNANGAIFGLFGAQHQDLSTSIVAYRMSPEDNALPATIENGKVAIRANTSSNLLRSATTGTVAGMWGAVLDKCNSDYLGSLPVTYQGQELVIPFLGKPSRPIADAAPPNHML